MPFDREWSNRGGKPLVSLGVNGGRSRLDVFAPAPLCLTFGTMQLVKPRAPNQLKRDFPLLREV